jgi:hypothetical protein
MRLRTFYAAAILLPLVAQAIVVPLGVGDTELATPLPAGATAEWLYPRSGTRGQGEGAVTPRLGRAAEAQVGTEAP